jgi:hypothetical protein
MELVSWKNKIHLQPVWVLKEIAYRAVAKYYKEGNNPNYKI